MELEVYAIYDLAGEQWLPTFTAKTLGEATRTFTEVANDQREGSLIPKYPHQYCLYHIGHWDPVVGRYTMLEEKKEIGLATRFQRKQESQVSSLN